MVALPIYFFLSIYFGRKNPLFFLLFPLALQQGPGAFIDQSLSFGGKRFFSVYDTIFNDVLFIIILLISIFLLKSKFPSFRHSGTRLILGYFIYVLVLVLLNIVGAQKPEETFFTARDFLYIGLGYFLWLAVFSSVSRSAFEGFLRVLFYVTPVSAVLYIVNSSGIISLFPKEFIYSEIDFELSNFFRDFATMPFFLIMVLVLTIQSLLMPILKLPKYLILVNITILPVALLFTFTRSLVITVVLQLSLIMFLNLFRQGILGFKNVVAFVVGCLLFLAPVYLVADKVFPYQVSYLTSRFSDASTEGAKEQNVDIRLTYLNKVVEITNYTNKFVGAGMNRKYYQQMNDIGAWKADSTVPFLLYHTGWVGVVLIYIVLIYFSAHSSLYYLKTGDWFVAYLASYFITTTISSLIMGGGSLYGSIWSFMNFGLYITTRYNLWKKTIIMIPSGYVNLLNKYSH